MSLAHHLLQTMSQAVCCCDEHGVVRASSPAAQTLLQHTPETLHDKSLLELVHADDIDRLEDALVSLTRQQTVAPCTLRLLNGDTFAHAYQTVRVRFAGHDEGSGLLEHILLWLEPTLVPAPARPQTSVAASAGTGSLGDKQAIATNDANDTNDPNDTNDSSDSDTSDDFYLATTPAALCVFDEQWRLVHLNETAAQLIDATVNDLLGKSLWQVFPDMQHQRIGAALKRAVETREPIYFETLSSDPRLDFAWFGVHALPVDNQLVVNVEDITGRKYHKQQLEVAQDRNDQLYEQRNAVLDTISDCIFVVDAHYRLTYANQVGLEQLSTTLEDLLGKTIWDVLYLPEGSPFRQLYLDTMSTGSPQRIRALSPRSKLLGRSVVLDVKTTPFRGGFIAYSRDVTEFETMRADLAQALADKEAVFDSITDGVTVLDRRGVYLYANKRVRHYTPDIVGKTYAELFPENQETIFETYYQRAFDTQEKVCFEGQTTRGQWMDVRVYPAGDRITIYATDFSERKQLEHALRDSETKFRAFFHDSTVPNFMIAYTDPSKQYVHIETNAAFKQLFAHTVFADIPSQLPVSDYRALAARLNKNNGEQTLLQPSPKEKRYYNTDGSHFWCEVSSVIIEDARSNATMCLSTLQDITDRKRAEQALRDSEAKFRNFFEHSSVPYTLTTYESEPSKNHFVYLYNDAFAQLVANTAFFDDFDAHSPRSVIAAMRRTTHPDDFAVQENALENISTHERDRYHLEKRYLNRDGSVIWVNVDTFVWFDEGIQRFFVIGTLQDITVRKETQVALEKALADKEMLLKEVHHRTKNNMQLISSMLSIQSRRIADDLARQALVDSSKRINLLASIHRALYQMPESGDIDAGEQLNYVLEGLARGLRDIPLTIDKDIASVLLDVHQAIPLMLVANEFLTNVFKHAFVTPQEGDSLRVRLALEGGQVTLEVSDNGVGVPEGAADKDSLGMVIIATLTDQLHADLTLENQPEGGTMARVTFECLLCTSRDG